MHDAVVNGAGGIVPGGIGIVLDEGSNVDAKLVDTCEVGHAYKILDSAHVVE